MCTKYLFPDFEKELRAKLLQEAKTYVFRESARKLNSILKVAPYVSDIQTFDGLDEDDSGQNGLTVLSIAYATSESDPDGNNSGSAAVCVCVTGDGEFDEYIRVNKIAVRLSQAQAEVQPSDKITLKGLPIDKQEKILDMERLGEFILNKMPKVIVVGTENKDALDIVKDIRSVITRLVERDKTTESSRLNEIKVELVDNEMPKLFETSKSAELEFGTVMPGLVKQAVCLARLIQDPLLCYSQLCNLERDVLSLKLHPMQQQIIAASGSRSSDDASELLRLLEVEFINAVNDVGVDLNRCNMSPHTSNCLQYVCGLGPRKAQHILKILRQQRSSLMNSISANKQHKTYPVAINRLFLVTKCSVGRRVLINCAGFIKFDVDRIEKEIEDDDENDDDIELLDSTRIHPETYEWARKMAVDALDFEDNNESSNYIAALKEIVYENSNKRLKDLDLDAFAAELDRTGHGNKLTTLYDIRSELTKRYRDKRAPYAAMNEEERFDLFFFIYVFMFSLQPEAIECL
jgi:transcription elongation factor SPT6